MFSSDQWRSLMRGLRTLIALLFSRHKPAELKTEAQTWPPVVQEWEAFKLIKQTITGPHEEIPDFVFRHIVASSHGVRPEDVTFHMMRSAMSDMIEHYKSVRIIDWLQVDRASADDNVQDPSEDSASEKSADHSILPPNGQECGPSDGENKNAKSMTPTAEVEAFLLHCDQSGVAGIKLIKKHIWLAAGHHNPRQFQYWQAGSDRATAQDDRNFRRILAMNPGDFVGLLKQKHII